MSIDRMHPRGKIPSSLTQPGAVNFWLAVVLTGLATGLASVALMKLLEVVQHLCWPGPTIIQAGAMAPAWKHVAILAGAGLLAGIVQFTLGKHSSGSGLDVTEAIWFSAGRIPKARTLINAVLAIVTVGMGMSLGKEGAPKQTGAVLANVFADLRRLSDNERRLLVAIGVGAGMSAAYGVPVGGALFALEVLLGMLALRLVLPALLCSCCATAMAWLFQPGHPTYLIPHYESSKSAVVWSVLFGIVAGFVSVWFVNAIVWADKVKPHKNGWQKLAMPFAALTLFGVVSIWFPQVLGNGKDVAQLAFNGELGMLLVIALLFLKPTLNVLCLGSGTPGGLFTPSLALGSLLGGSLGHVWERVWPGVDPGMCAVIGAATVIAATTHGPVSAVVLMMELVNHERSFILPLLTAVVVATAVARTIDARSLYEAKLSDDEVAERQKLREAAVPSGELAEAAKT